MGALGGGVAGQPDFVSGADVFSVAAQQSIVAGALTTMLDVSSLVLTGIEGVHPGQAKLTFAMARHAAVDLAQVVNARYDPAAPERLTDTELDALRQRWRRRDCGCAMMIMGGTSWRSCGRCMSRMCIRRRGI